MASPDADSHAFHDFEHAGWERAAAFYGDAFGALTAQTADALLEAAGAGPGTRLLDVACGPGFIAGAAAQRGAAVVGLDFSAAMIAQARGVCLCSRFKRAMPKRCRSTRRASTRSS